MDMTDIPSFRVEEGETECWAGGFEREGVGAVELEQGEAVRMVQEGELVCCEAGERSGVLGDEGVRAVEAQVGVESVTEGDDLEKRESARFKTVVDWWVESRGTSTGDPEG